MNPQYFNWRNRRNQLNMNNLQPLGQVQYHSIASYCTDTQTKTDMKTTYGDEFLFTKLHMMPDPLKKNLADTLITGEEKKSVYGESKPPTQTTIEGNQGDNYPTLTGISNFISGFFNVLSGTIFHKRAKSPPPYESYVSPIETKSWQTAKDMDQNKNTRAHDHCEELNVEIKNMSDECRTVAEQCAGKLNNLRELLASKSVSRSPRRNTKPRKVYVGPGSVEDSFEDAFSPEDFVSLSNDTPLCYSSPYNIQTQDLLEVDAPKTKTEETSVPKTLNIAETVTNLDNKTLPYSPLEKETNMTNSKLKTTENLHKEKKSCTKNLVPKKSNTLNHSKTEDKKYKNHHRTSSKRQKTQLRKNIDDDIRFALEIDSENISSAENSPCIKERVLPCSTPPHSNDFDEIKGCFHLNNDENFQIVFNDVPKFCRTRKPSDCESEDSFIVFDDTADSCYITNDVFGSDTGESSDYSTDSYESDSDEGCAVKLPHCLSRSVGDLTDLSLYKSEDEVDCCMTTNIPEVVAMESNGLLMTEAKKLLRKNQPPKKVQFSPHPPKVRVMRVWAFAASQARIGHWEQYARDRDRFQRRIADVDMAVSWVLKPQHRSRVMFQRFMPWWNAEKRRERAEKEMKEKQDKLEEQKVSEEQTILEERKQAGIPEVPGIEEILKTVAVGKVPEDAKVTKESQSDDTNITSEVSSTSIVNSNQIQSQEVADVSKMLTESVKGIGIAQNINKHHIKKCRDGHDKSEIKQNEKFNALNNNGDTKVVKNDGLVGNLNTAPGKPCEKAVNFESPNIVRDISINCISPRYLNDLHVNKSNTHINGISESNHNLLNDKKHADENKIELNLVPVADVNKNISKNNSIVEVINKNYVNKEIDQPSKLLHNKDKLKTILNV